MSIAPFFPQENARSIVVVNHGGRPPDFPDVSTDDPTRGRAESPFALDGSRSTKKGRLNGVESKDSDTLAMDADEVGDPVIGEDGLHLPKSDAMRGAALNESYASKLAGSGATTGMDKCFFKDEVRGLGVRNDPPTSSYVALGSRFSSLEIEESDGQVMRRKEDKAAATVAAHGKQVVVLNADEARLQLVVVPESSKESVQVIEHNTGFMKGDHRTMLINEQGRFGGHKGVRGDQRRTSILGSGKFDVSRHHLHVRRGNGNWVSGNVSAVVFARQLTVDLDTVGVKGLPNSSRGLGRLSGEMSLMLHSSNEEEFYRSDSPEILPEGAVFADNQ
ncbi:hypothetical protein V6N12_044220 [Hibiscus sabdariffa]|uniref:Uncharacterized protein n=1 Tax=Hibiscus sabdariffa TaxID=183260 RepID=A0ABR2DGL7_9ROSI